MNELKENNLEVINPDKYTQKVITPNDIRLSTNTEHILRVSTKERAIIKNIKRKSDESQKSAIKKLVIISFISIIFMGVELVGNHLSGSIAILSDALHMFCDFSGFFISMTSIIISKRKSNMKMSFGYHRAEVFGAILSILIIWVLIGFLIYEGVQKIQMDKIELDATIMLIVSSLGFVCNLIMGLILLYNGPHEHSHMTKNDKKDNKKIGKIGNCESNKTDPLLETTSELKLDKISSHDNNKKNINDEYSLNDEGEDNHEIDNNYNEDNLEKFDTYKTIKNPKVSNKDKKNKYDFDHLDKSSDYNEENINIKAAKLNVIGDLLQSITVCICAVVILIFGEDFNIIDPILSFVLSGVIFVTTIPVLRDCIRIFMEGTPKDIDLNEIIEDLKKISGVVEVHDMHVWALNMSNNCLSCHIISNNPNLSLKRITRLINTKYKILNTTIQIEGINNEDYICDTLNK